jgi:serine O-acetyltransferase
MGNTKNEQASKSTSPFGLDEVVIGLRASREVHSKIRHRGDVRQLPSREILVQILKGLSAALFPTHYGRTDLSDETIDYYVGSTLSDTLNLLAEQIRRGLLFNKEVPSDGELVALSRKITHQFAHQLPSIRDVLVTDIHAAYSGDPAANSMSEILICYPGITAVTYYRLAHALHRLGVPLLARLISDIAHSVTGIDIHPAAKIGRSFFIDHGTGVVIGETCIIGERVRLYQQVTLGAKRFPADENGNLVKGNDRHPIVEDDVVIYAGATILGRVTIGRGSVIGGNVWLTRDVQPGSNVAQANCSE